MARIDFYKSRRNCFVRNGFVALGIVVALGITPSQGEAAPLTTSFVVGGAVEQPGSYALPALAALPQQTESVTYTAGGTPVSASFGGPSLWTVLGAAELSPVPGAKNGDLRDVVVAIGGDGYAVAYSGGELDPRFGGSRTPALAAITENGGPLGADGFARTTAPGDLAGGRYVSNLAALTVALVPDNPSAGGGLSSSFKLSGLVAHPATYDAAALTSLPAVTEAVTYTAAGSPVSAMFTGVTLWSLLNASGLLTDPAIKNDELRDYVLATGSDGYEAAFSLGELDPRFGGSGAPDLVAYAENGGSLGADGFARLVVPGDAAGGRYVSNLVSLQVLDATAVPEPSGLALSVAAAGVLAACSRAGRRLVRRDRSLRTSLAAALLSVFVAGGAQAAPPDVGLPGDRAYPESLSATSDGTLYVGSFAQGGVSRAAPGASEAEMWIKPGAGGSRSTFGVLADELSRTLYVCSNDVSAMGVAGPGEAKGSALFAFDLASGEVKGSTKLPGETTLCNDIAIGPDGAAYVTDSFNPHILRLAPGAAAFEVWASDSRFAPPKGGAGLDGIAFGSDGAVYVNTFTAAEMFKIPVADGRAGEATPLIPSRKLTLADALRRYGRDRFLMIEGDGELDVVTISGDLAEIRTIKDGLAGPVSVAQTGDTAWVAEGQLPYLLDPKLKQQAPHLPFRIVAVKLPAD